MLSLSSSHRTVTGVLPSLPRGASLEPSPYCLFAISLLPTTTLPTVLFPLPRHLLHRENLQLAETEGMSSTTTAATPERQHGRKQPFPSSCPITTARCVLHFAPTKKSSKPFHLLRWKISFGRSWGDEAVMDSEDRVPLGVEILSLHSYSSLQQWQIAFLTLVAQWLSLSTNFSHWHMPPMLFPSYLPFKMASL